VLKVSDTQEKLLEAEYFLKQMKEVRADRAAFKYNLSAFLSAARSVTFYMQKEFARVLGFDEWYKAEQEKMQRDPGMRFFVEARNLTLKQQHVPTRADIRVEITDSIGVSDSIGTVVKRDDGTEERMDSERTEATSSTQPQRSDTKVEWRWYFADPPPGYGDQEVITLCAAYVSTLEALVNRCEAQFAS
jgi:hypothetical protein